jgi:uncharacterized membrane protein YdjX (TVP38/TMEM64 family)
MGQLIVNVAATLGSLLYFVLGFCYFNEWLDLFQIDASMTKQQRQISVIVLIVGTLLWPVLVPFAYLELLKSQKKRARIEIMFNQPNPKSLD